MGEQPKRYADAQSAMKVMSGEMVIHFTSKSLTYS